MKDSFGRDASDGEVWLHDPDFDKGLVISSLFCIEHEGFDGLEADPNGLLHGVIVNVPVSLMEKAGTYRFVLYFYDDYTDSYKNHQVKAALEVNALKKPIAYIIDVEDGWLMVRLEPSKEVISLPYTLKVQWDSTKEGRDYFTILEGVHKNKKASIKRRTDGKSYLKVGPKYKSLIKLVYYKSRKILKIVGRKEEYSAIMVNPLPNGTYIIELPDYPHSGGEAYRDKAKRARTWFRIRTGGGRYLHTGSVSAGCLTVTDVEKWDSLYDAIIWCRKDGNDNAHGTVEVRD